MLAGALAKLPEAANLDAEFREAARMWNARLCLRADQQAHLVRIEDGRVAAIEAGAADYDVRISGPAAGWGELLALVPRPFYQDLWGAMAHHGFAVDGDERSFHAYYPAARRLLELLRS